VPSFGVTPFRPQRKKHAYILAVLVSLASVAAVTMPCVAVIILKKRRKGKQLTNQSLKKLKNFLTAHKNTLASYSYRS